MRAPIRGRVIKCDCGDTALIVRIDIVGEWMATPDVFQELYQAWDHARALSRMHPYNAYSILERDGSEYIVQHADKSVVTYVFCRSCDLGAVS